MCVSFFQVILTNLSTANPTRVNGEVLAQSERLKHGDTITIVDRSFRSEWIKEMIFYFFAFKLSKLL